MPFSVPIPRLKIPRLRKPVTVHRPEYRAGAGSTLGPRDRPLPLTRAFVLLLLVAVALIGLVIGNRHYTALVAHTLEVRSAAYRLLALVQDAETGQRGYMITGDADYLKPHRRGAADAPHALAELAALIADNPRQRDEVAALQPLVTEKLALLANAVALQERGDIDEARALLRT